mmetsp:Transcript_5111/g.8368  ORF Transcript_5111/g.8368 Transcript_5111/m.8368 type:complete len:234 (+) Transcript_5111:85-786(+)
MQKDAQTREAELALRSQIHFSGDVDCDKFCSNRFAKSGKIVRKCMSCGHDVANHTSDSVSSTDIKKVLESVESVPSEIIPKLYLGGFIAAMNMTFLTDNGVTFVVNTAKGLETQFPKYGQVRSGQYQSSGVESYSVEWVDSEDQQLDIQQLQAAVQEVHVRLMDDQGVLIHCAQGRSRSTTLVVAYLMWAQGSSYDEALAIVQRARDMAQPNPAFERQLQELWAPHIATNEAR